MQAKPFLKWVGSKRAQAEAIAAVLPDPIKGLYFEPMCGSASLFFHLANAGRLVEGCAVLSDVNEELMRTFEAVKDCPGDVVKLLKAFPDTKDTFSFLRRLPVESLDGPFLAARMLFLNRTTFNGLYRVNKAGEFNAPYAAKDQRSNGDLVRAPELQRASRSLDEFCMAVMAKDFRALFAEMEPKEHDVVYFDPPYDGTFDGYGAAGFTDDDQAELARIFHSLTDASVAVVVSNSDTPKVRTWYDGATIRVLPARRSVNRDGEKRGKVGDLLISNRHCR